VTFLVQFKRFRRGVPKLSERFTLQPSMAPGLAPHTGGAFHAVAGLAPQVGPFC
jgi:hypothetical protein